MYRILDANQEVPPSTGSATGPNQVWTWDITRQGAPEVDLLLPLDPDIFSRQVVGWMVAVRRLAKKLIRETVTGKGSIAVN